MNGPDGCLESLNAVATQLRPSLEKGSAVPEFGVV
jgi:hypothetical protein